MKKMLPLLLLAIAARSEAQELKPGQKMLGGNFSFGTSHNVNENRQSSVNFSPSFAVVKNKNTIYGGFVLFNFYGTKYDTLVYGGNFKRKDFDGGLGFFVQKLKWLNDKWFLYAEAGVQGGIGTRRSYDVEDASKTSKANIWNAGVYITPGISYRITERLLIDARFNNLLAVSYSQQKAKKNTLQNMGYSDYDYLSASTSLNNNTLGNIGIGFRWLLK